MIVALAGKPLIGKSELANNLTNVLSGVLLNEGALRDLLFPEGKCASSPEQNDYLLTIILQTAVWHLEATPGRVVVLDGRPLASERDVQALQRFADGVGQQFYVVDCVTRCNASREREGEAHIPGYVMEGDRGENPMVPVSNLVLDVTQPPNRCLDLVMRFLEGHVNSASMTYI